MCIIVIIMYRQWEGLGKFEALNQCLYHVLGSSDLLEDEDDSINGDTKKADRSSYNWVV